MVITTFMNTLKQDVILTDSIDKFDADGKRNFVL